jgi:hypothetical protein
MRWARAASVRHTDASAAALLPAVRRRALAEVPRGCAVAAAGAPLARREVSARYPAPEEGVMSELLLDAAGRRRSPATLPDFHSGRPPRNKGVRYPADPPTTEEIVTVMRRAGTTSTDSADAG